MKFEIVLREDDVNKLVDAINEADDKGCENMTLTLKINMDAKTKKCKIENGFIYGECTTEYVTGNIW